MASKSAWLWPALVVALFCLPLFVGLNRNDLRGDEAFYSFSVDRMLETGDWLIPRSSPFEDEPFYEKPPLKFWIVAGAMKLGLLPHNEFGMRFWDVLFSGVAFLYVYATGRRIAGALCGAVAVLLLFIHHPLLYEHGLRENNMEAPLFLCYCGAMYHYLAWATSRRSRGSGAHVLAVALYFTLGFMVKFVAALFLPAVLGVTILLLPSHRARLFRDWRQWGVASAVALLLIAPWFAYAYNRFGADFWHVIFGVHVYDRMTVGLDPSHVHSGGFYFSQLYQSLQQSHVLPIAIAGSILLAVETIRQRWAEGFVLLLWFALPIALISLPTSKLYYYAYPFLPPVALATGYLFAWCWSHFQPLAPRAVDAIDRWLRDRLPAMRAADSRPVLRRIFLSLSVAATAIVIWTLLFGWVDISVGGTRLLKSSGFLRPWIVAVIFGLLAGRTREVGRYLIVPLVLMWAMPLAAYRESLPNLTVGRHPMHSARDCLNELITPPPGDTTAWHGLYVAGPGNAFGHQHYYYFRGLRPWERDETPADDKLYRYLYEPSEQRPALVAASTYRAFAEHPGAGAVAPPRGNTRPPALVTLDDAVLVLPGPYARCAAPESDSAAP